MPKAKRDEFGRALKKDGTIYLSRLRRVIFESDENKSKRAHLEVMDCYADEIV